MRSRLPTARFIMRSDAASPRCLVSLAAKAASILRPSVLPKVPQRAALVALAFLAGCARDPGGVRMHSMGDRAEVGTLIYTVLEAEWFSHLGEGPAARTPKNQFLVLRLNVTNSGPTEITIPAMTLVDPGGRTYEQEGNGEDVPDWLGLLRRVQPAQTEQGRVLFDVPRGDYQLRVTDDAFEPEDLKVALIQIPLRFESHTSTLPR